MDEPITKRLIISGLTPAITADDISKRLTTFGTVKAADGFGLPDGLGEPRKFGYVTLETTTTKLAKCMNLLSGSKWKGAKLRFGEAQPDYAERIALENKKAAEEPPKKKRKRFGGVEAEDMSPVTPETASSRPGWKVSELGRITRPVKMRPAHPLTSTPEDKPKPKAVAVKFSDVKSAKDTEKKKKKRPRDPDSRARRRAIDMTKFGSTHLKGMFLDLEVVPGSSTTRKGVAYEELEPVDDSGSDSDEEMAVEEIVNAAAEDSPAVPLSPKELVVEVESLPTVRPPAKTPVEARSRPPAPSPAPRPSQSPTTPPSEKFQATSSPEPKPSAPISAPVDPSADIQQEKTQTLSLLASLFGGADDDDWVGRESVGSDIDPDELIKGDRMLVDEEDAGFEVVPSSAPAKQMLPVSDEESDEEMPVVVVKEGQPSPEAQVKDAKPKTLKDLFAPQEEEAGFSLFGNLGLDIDLDEDVPYAIEDATEPQSAEPAQPIATALPTAPITVQSHTTNAPLVLDARQALFFPLPQTDGGVISHRARQRDVYDLAKDNGWNWRDRSIGFFKTGTDEDIRKRWEESKGDLTRDWKRRCREAAKVTRRKRGGVEGEAEY
ncbi:hypothetical protein D9619_006760 [Psilocybe cf. subviscida]|uniref:RRM domain-containing protein n=1 Tax=Psilocybe cf. subviscida TaxID=2480587 RepID=A0A8H5B452_9AGAR|nr:hypothetical protein D9619_006760 [Psilocybe cf. subviscida]